VRLIALSVLAVGLVSARDLNEVLGSVQRRYNRASTLEAGFEQSYQAPGRARRVESGKLTLRKPGRMRWEYASPQGKLFVSDGKWLWFYSPSAGRAEKSRLKETEDMRAPLAFLLGKLDFKRDFSEFTLKDEGRDVVITALPKTDRVPYTRVEFTVTPDNEIRRLVVAGTDRSVMEFRFTAERLNPALSDALFRYKAPDGVPVIEVTRPGEEEER
jgi:outer membrane lipoprotein carrier protein